MAGGAGCLANSASHGSVRVVSPPCGTSELPAFAGWRNGCRTLIQAFSASDLGTLLRAEIPIIVIDIFLASRRLAASSGSLAEFQAAVSDGFSAKFLHESKMTPRRLTDAGSLLRSLCVEPCKPTMRLRTVSLMAEAIAESAPSSADTSAVSASIPQQQPYSRKERRLQGLKRNCE